MDANRMPSPGDVIHFWWTAATPRPKEKFAIVGCIEPKVRLLLINSEINALVNNTPELVEHHVPIDVKSHGFLTYDSYVDCANPIGGDYQYLCSSAQVKGTVSNDVLQQMRDVIEKSELLSSYEIEHLLNGLPK